MNILPCLIYFEDYMKASKLPIFVKSIVHFAVFYGMINDHLSHIQLISVVLKRKGFIFLTFPIFTQLFYFLKLFPLSWKEDGLPSILPSMQWLLSIMVLEAVDTYRRGLLCLWIQKEWFLEEIGKQVVVSVCLSPSSNPCLHKALGDVQNSVKQQ